MPRRSALWLVALAMCAGAAYAQGAQDGSHQHATTAAGDDRLAIARRGIVLIDPNGRNARKLTGRPDWLDYSPTWSPDGQRIAFTRTTNNYRSFQIFVKRVAGGRAQRLTEGRFDEDPDWSPDGQLIAYSSMGIKFVRPNGSRAGSIPRTRDAVGVAWSPDGRRLAYGRNGYVWIVRRNGTARRRVVRGRDPDWSPDGERLVYSPRNGGVATIGTDGKGRRFLANGMLPAWSPDGERIAFQTWPAGNVFQTWAMDADGSDRRRVTREGGHPAWRPLPR